MRNEIDCNQARDFWNQTGKIECILLWRHSRLKDEIGEALTSPVKRAEQYVAEICDLLLLAVFVLSQAQGPGRAIAAWIAVNRSCKKSERSSQFSLADKCCLIVFPLPHSQAKPGSKGLRDAEQPDRHLTGC